MLWVPKVLGRKAVTERPVPLLGDLKQALEMLQAPAALSAEYAQHGADQATGRCKGALQAV